MNTATDYAGFATNTTVTDTEAFSAEVVQTISIDTGDGLGGRFKLQVQEDDLGYIDVKERA